MVAECEINQSQATHLQADNARVGTPLFIGQTPMGGWYCLFRKEREQWQLLLLSNINKMLRIFKTFSVAACGYEAGLGCSPSWLLSSVSWLPSEQSCPLGKTAGLASVPAEGREPIPLVCTIASGPGIHSLPSCQRTILDPVQLAGVPGTPMSLCVNCSHLPLENCCHLPLPLGIFKEDGRN